MNIQEHRDGVVVKVKVQPRASKDRIAGIMGDALKITLTAPPVDGEANAACIGFLASLLKIPRSNIEILSGVTGRTKLLKIYGIKSTQFKGKIEEYTKK